MLNGGNFAGEEVVAVALLVQQEKQNSSFKDEGLLHDAKASTLNCFLHDVDCAPFSHVSIGFIFMPDEC